MKKLTTFAAIAVALASGSAFAERGSAEQNTIEKPSSSSEQRSDESRNASVENLRIKNSAGGQMINHPESNTESRDNDFNDPHDLPARNQ
ncbi:MULTISPECIES: hypothetical protein [unclassified Vreelandella]